MSRNLRSGSVKNENLESSESSAEETEEEEEEYDNPILNEVIKRPPYSEDLGSKLLGVKETYVPNTQC